MAEVILMEERASKGLVHDYYTNVSNVNKNYREPPSIYKTLMDMCELDPVLFSACSLTADLVTYKGYDFIGNNGKLKKVNVKMLIYMIY